MERKDGRPTLPLIPSQLSAERTCRKQLSLARREVRDRDGLVWQAQVESLPAVAHPEDSRCLLWSFAVDFSAQTTAVDLIATGCLHPVQDLRLVELLGPGPVRLTWLATPRLLEGKSEIEAKNLARQAAASLTEQISSQADLKAWKRRQIGIFLEQKFSFSMP